MPSSACVRRACRPGSSWWARSSPADAEVLLERARVHGLGDVVRLAGVADRIDDLLASTDICCRARATSRWGSP
ncbi:MAG: hypothetical protein R2736_06965 [Solirubrobacterales bacterium]